MNARKTAVALICILPAVIIWSLLTGGGITKAHEGLVRTTNPEPAVPRGHSPIGLRGGSNIVLRIDDISGSEFDDAKIRLIDTVLGRNLSVVLAVIPSDELRDDVKLRDYLSDRARDPRVEIAQHGLNHTFREFINLSYDDAHERIEEGRRRIVAELNVTPTSFIPPHNMYSPGTERALIDLNYTVLSSGNNELDLAGPIKKMGANAATKNTGDTKLIPVNKVLFKCAGKKICVIVIHPTDYAKEDHTLDEDKFKEFELLLSYLHETKTFSALNADIG